MALAQSRDELFLSHSSHLEDEEGIALKFLAQQVIDGSNVFARV
jgi:hypothetical protein